MYKSKKNEMERESPYYCLSRKFEPTNTFLDMVWCYSGLKINFIAFNREGTIIKYLNQDSIKPFSIVHLAALWALIYQIHLSRNTHLNKQILMKCLLNISDLHRPLQDPEGKGSAYWNGRWFLRYSSSQLLCGYVLRQLQCMDLLQFNSPSIRP